MYDRREIKYTQQEHKPSIQAQRQSGYPILSLSARGQGNGSGVVERHTRSSSSDAIDVVRVIDMHGLHLDDLPLISVQEGIHIVMTIPIVAYGFPRIVAVAVSGTFSPGAALWAGAGWVGTPVLAVGNAQVGVLWLVLDSVNGLDSVRDIGEVDEGTVPNWVETQFNDAFQSKDENRTNVLLFQEVDELDVTVFAEIAFQLLFSEGLVVFNVSDVDIAGGARVDGEREGRGQRARVLSPTNLQATVVQGEPLIGCHLEECICSVRVDECDELRRKEQSHVSDPNATQYNANGVE